jgi:hypothetical protein
LPLLGVRATLEGTEKGGAEVERTLVTLGAADLPLLGIRATMEGTGEGGAEGEGTVCVSTQSTGKACSSEDGAHRGWSAVTYRIGGRGGLGGSGGPPCSCSVTVSPPSPTPPSKADTCTAPVAGWKL